jgi:hypothetical protein
MVLTDYIITTSPLLAPEACQRILTAADGSEWRVPSYPGFTRTCTTFPISAAVDNKYPCANLERVKEADQTLLSATLMALTLYRDKHPRIKIQSDVGFDILRYGTGQSIGEHVDDLAPRVLAMSIALNDDYTGGEFQFWDHKPFRLPGGCALMFPPSFMYPHQVLGVTSGTRYSMITWFV